MLPSVYLYLLPTSAFQVSQADVSAFFLEGHTQKKIKTQSPSYSHSLPRKHTLIFKILICLTLFHTKDKISCLIAESEVPNVAKCVERSKNQRGCVLSLPKENDVFLVFRQQLLSVQRPQSGKVLLAKLSFYSFFFLQGLCWPYTPICHHLYVIAVFGIFYIHSLFSLSFS